MFKFSSHLYSILQSKVPSILTAQNKIEMCLLTEDLQFGLQSTVSPLSINKPL